LRKQSFIGW